MVIVLAFWTAYELLNSEAARSRLDTWRRARLSRNPISYPPSSSASVTRANRWDRLLRSPRLVLTPSGIHIVRPTRP